MPTYEYECKSCQHTFEKFQSITARPTRRCPLCGKGVRRLLGAGSGIIFRGSGFYETDYKRKDAKGKAGSGDPPAAANKEETSAAPKEKSDKSD